MAGQTMAKPRGDKTQRYVFYLGLALAAIAAIIVFAVVSSGGGGGGDTVPVVVANEAIPADTRVTSEMLGMEFLAPDEVTGEVFTSRSQLVNRVVTEDVAAGATVTPSMVSDVAGDGLTFKVAQGMRGISVEVREVVTAGGNVVPGDHVDVVGIFEVPDADAANQLLQVLGLDYTVVEPPRPATSPTAEGENEEKKETLILTVTMLQDVKLLAIAQSLTEASAGGAVAEELEETESVPRAATATLELPPQMAQEITWADHFGVLRMDARAVGDDGVVEVLPTLLRIERVN